MKKYKYEIIVFIVEAVFMTLELVASRVLSPYFGNTNVVWTSVIGIILLSCSLGNYIGGIIADKKESEKSLKLILVLASVFIFLIPIIQGFLLEKISLVINGIKLGAVISTICLFFIPSLLLGLINPIVLKKRLLCVENAGKVSGRIYAISTIGGILGTFLSGFYLIPSFGSVQMLFGLSIILLLLSLFLKGSKKQIIIIILLIIIDICLFCVFYKENIVNLNNVLDGKINVKASLDTQYGKVNLYNIYYGFDKVRVLNIDGGYESATFVDDSKNELVYEYTKYYDLMFKSKNDIKNVLMIGGGGYSYPKYFISHYLDKNIDVVEIDEDVTRIAKKYFYLDDVIKEYKASSRINLINEDGRTFINNNTKKYDAILNDTFTGEIPAKDLTTLEAIKKIKSSLSSNGLYLSNVISSLNGKNSLFLKSEVKTLKEVFKNVYVVACNSLSEYDVQNFMVIATDDDIYIEKSKKVNLTDENLILTDNYCPIESLIPSVF